MKTRQHRAIRVLVTGAGMVRSARTALIALAVLAVLVVPTATAFLLLTMVTEHGVTGRTSTDRLAAVDTRAGSARQAVGLRPNAPGKLARHGHRTESEQPR
jgi:hypothetical protein